MQHHLRNQALQGNIIFPQNDFARKSILDSFGLTTVCGLITSLCIWYITFARSQYKPLLKKSNIFLKIPSPLFQSISYLNDRFSLLADTPHTGAREYIDNTALDALASIGGLWTFGNSFFALVFGSSLLGHFLVFGFVHLFIRGRLRRATPERCPDFHCEREQPGEAEAGVLALIRQHLLGAVEGEEVEDAGKKRRIQWERQRMKWTL
ncbi:hypothetical protein DL96DRAFT_1716198 [Flagelloscypha sp. PMI_526]|nr:hypothetical protein DL96DRAFT_1716198 [Flagelloscypha sp. PMI_526]